MRTLYVSDLDGTLLQSDARLSDFTISSLNKLIGSGTLFTVATARTPATVSTILRDVRLSLPAIVMTGAAFWNVHENVYSDIKYMKPDVVASLVDAYKFTGCPTFIYTLVGNMIHIYHLGDMSELETRFMEERAGSPFKLFHIGKVDAELLLDDPRNVILFYSMQPTALSYATYNLCLKSVKDCRLQFYHDIYGEETGILEAFSKEATKARAVRSLAHAAGAERIVAFGDNINDIPMLKAADVAVAVGNAIPEVKEIADVVIGPNTDDSVVKFIMEMEGIEFKG